MFQPLRLAERALNSLGLNEVAMPIARVQTPDGRIARFEVPEGTTPKQVEAFAAQHFGVEKPAAPAAAPASQNQPAAPYGGRALAAAEQALQGASFGWADEAINPLAAVIGTAINEPSALISGDIQSPRLAKTVAGIPAATKQRMQQQAEAYPYTSGAAQLAGGIASTMAAPGAIPAWAAKGGVAARMAKGAMLAAPAGVAYGAGVAEGPLQERIAPALTSGAIAGAVGMGIPAAGAAARSIANSPAGKAVREGAKRGIDYLSDVLAKKGISQQTVAMQIQGGMDDFAQAGRDLAAKDVAAARANIAGVQQGRMLPLTAGQLSQEPGQQAIEEAALKGVYGPELQQSFIDLQRKQGGAASDILQAMGGGAIKSSARETKALYLAGRRATNALKRNVAAKYAAAEKLTPFVRFDAQQFGSDIKTAIKKNLEESGFDPANPSHSNANSLLKMAEQFIGAPGQTQISLSGLEKFRKNINQAIYNSTDPTQRFYAAKVKDALDNTLDNAIAGDPAYEALREARAANRLFESVMENDDLLGYLMQKTDIGRMKGMRENVTIERIQRSIFGSGEAGKVGKNPDIGRFFQSVNMLVPKGPQRDQMNLLARRAIISNALEGALERGVTDAGDFINYSPQRMFQAVKSISDNETLMNTVFKGQKDTINALTDDLSRIVTKMPGVVNSSNSGVQVNRMMLGIMNRMADLIPGGRAATAFMPGAQDMAQGELIQKAKEGLVPVYGRSILNERTGLPEAGAAVGIGQLSGSIVKPQGTTK